MPEPNVNTTPTPTIEPTSEPTPAAGAEPVVEDKQTNRTFSQSEHDAEVARVKRETSAKYSDYDEMKAQYDQLLADKKERELNDMSEVEKAKAIAEDLAAKLEAEKSRNESLALDQLKTDILSKPEFQALPRAYRNMVGGTDEASITADAERVVEEYKVDTKGMKNIPDFGPKKTKDNGAEPPAAQSTIKDIIAEAGKRFGIVRPGIKE
jgi:hypothetical protein